MELGRDLFSCQADRCLPDDDPSLHDGKEVEQCCRVRLCLADSKARIDRQGYLFCE